MSERGKETGLSAFLTGSFFKDPYPIYAQIREKSPLFRLPNGMLLVTRYADVDAVLRDRRFIHDTARSIVERHGEHVMRHPVLQWITSVVANTNPPDHTRIRQLMVSAFSAKRVEAMRARIQEIVDRLIEAVKPSGRMDVIADFAHSLPLIVICDLLGVPEADRAMFLDEPMDFARAADPTPMSKEVRDAQNLMITRVLAYFAELAERRRREPGDDLLTALVHAEEEDHILSDAEVVDNAAFLFAAGHETTANLIGNGLLALHRNPDQLALLKSRPALMPAAVEELLRYDTPVQLTEREAAEDLEIAGHRVERGETVVPVMGAANRDPSAFESPDRLDITRQGPRNFSFGQGIHYCLGAQLARLEGGIALTTLLARLPDLRLDVEKPTWRRNANIRGLMSLPASW